jgi:uncharacterized protein (TIGR03086 family)
VDAADRYRRIAAEFSARVDAVPADAWDRPAPCEGWRARDVVGHLVGWIPGTVLGASWTGAPSAEDDPVGAWHALDAALQSALDDPTSSTVELDLPPGRMTRDRAIDMICTNDVLFHTWDLARATGLDERLLQDEVEAVLAGIEPMDEPMRASGHFGPRVAVPDDADAQTRLLAFLGRRP